MKKLSLYIFLVLMWCNTSFANRLGIEAKKLDMNFDCELAKDVLANSGVPNESIETMPESLRNYKFGYKEYNHPDDDLVLLHLDYSNRENKYLFPDSVATRWKSEELGVKFYYISYVYGAGYLFEIINRYYGEEEFFVSKNSYKVDKENSNKFDKKFTEANKLPDDGFVKSLAFLTKDFYDYAEKNKGKRSLSLPYHCKPS